MTCTCRRTALLAAAAFAASAHAFQPGTGALCKGVQCTRATSGLRTVRTRPVSMVVDPEMMHHASQLVSSMDVDQVWLGHVMQGLADTATLSVDSVKDAAGAAVEEAAKKDGWFDQLVNFIEGDIKGINNFYRENLGIKESFGLSIISFTLIVKTLLLPLNIFQIQSTEKTLQLQPTLKEIQRRYSNNKVLQQQITQKLYKSTEVNPLAGCLPSLAQIPIFIGLYRALTQMAQENIANEPFLWLPNLAGPVFEKGRGIEWLTQNWVDFTPPMGWPDTIAYCSIPLFLVISQSISMKLLSPPTDPNDASAQRTQQVLKYLPLMIGWFSLNVPAALGVYWMANNLITTTATLSIKQYFKANPPKIDIPEDITNAPPVDFMYPTRAEAVEEARLNAKPSRQRRRVAA